MHYWIIASYLLSGLLIVYGQAFGGDDKSPGIENNVDLIVSIEGIGEPEQVFYRTENRLDYEVQSVRVEENSRLKLKVESLDPDGKRQDITESEYIKIFTTFYKVHECEHREICVWPQPGKEPRLKFARYGGTEIEVEYITPEGVAGWNGIVLDVQPIEHE